MGLLLINNVLGDLNNVDAFPYIDDIIIPSTTFEQGVMRLRKVLQKLRENNLALKLSKCSFFKTKINDLELEISRAGIRPGSVKVEAVLNIPDPQNVK